MEQPIDKKIHRPLYIFIITFLFGPLAGGIATGLDYKSEGGKKWIYVLLAPTVIGLTAILILEKLYPGLKITSFVLPLALSSVYYLYQKQLEEKISGIKSYRPLITTLLLGIAGFVLFILVAIPFGILLNLNSSASIY